MKELARAIMSAKEDPLTCSDCEEQLAEYVEAKLSGEEDQFPAVAYHLQVCPHCAKAYQELKTLMDLAYGDLIPVQQPTFDLSFLDQPAALSSIWQTVQDEVRRITVDLTLHIEKTRVALASVPDLLMPYHHLQPLPAALRTRSSGEEDLQEELDLPDPETNMRIRFFTGPAQTGRGTVKVVVEEMAPPGPVQRARVSLYSRERQLLERMNTAVDGAAVLRDLDTGSYILQIQHQGQYEIFFNIAQTPGLATSGA